MVTCVPTAPEAGEKERMSGGGTAERRDRGAATAASAGAQRRQRQGGQEEVERRRPGAVSVAGAHGLVLSGVGRAGWLASARRWGGGAGLGVLGSAIARGAIRTAGPDPAPWRGGRRAGRAACASPGGHAPGVTQRRHGVPPRHGAQPPATTLDLGLPEGP